MHANQSQDRIEHITSCPFAPCARQQRRDPRAEVLAQSWPIAPDIDVHTENFRLVQNSPQHPCVVEQRNIAFASCQRNQEPAEGQHAPIVGDHPKRGDSCKWKLRSSRACRIPMRSPRRLAISTGTSDSIMTCSDSLPSRVLRDRLCPRLPMTTRSTGSDAATWLTAAA